MESLLDTTNSLKNLFNGIAKCIEDVIVVIDPVYFKIKYVNHLKHGYKLDDVLGVEVFNFIYPQHIKKYNEVLVDVVQHKQTVNFNLEVIDKSNPEKSVWYYCSISPITNQENQIEEIVIISKDITNSKLLDIEIHNKNEKLYAIINNTSDIITSIDKDLRIMEYNSVFSSIIEGGFGKINLSGKFILDYIDPSKHQHLKNIYTKVFSGKIINDIESFKTSSGSFMYMETSFHPIFDFKKEVIGISIFSKNITERILNEQKLKNTLKEKEVLLAEIHHRIKNNLALISSILQLKEMNLENHDAKEALIDSRKRIKSTALVHEMLYRNETFDNIEMRNYLFELFNSLNSNPKYNFILNGDNYVFDLSKALPFGLMMHELMMNSFKHSFKNRDEAQIKVTTNVQDGELHIDYCDCNGSFPADVDFYNTSTTGLMLIHTFIEQLNGSIKLKGNEPPSYTINIPLK